MPCTGSDFKCSLGCQPSLMWCLFATFVLSSFSYPYLVWIWWVAYLPICVLSHLSSSDEERGEFGTFTFRMSDMAQSYLWIYVMFCLSILYIAIALIPTSNKKPSHQVFIWFVLNPFSFSSTQERYVERIAKE